MKGFQRGWEAKSLGGLHTCSAEAVISTSEYKERTGTLRGRTGKTETPEPDGVDMEEKTVLVPAISCGHCVMTIQRELGEVEGVVRVHGEEATKRVTVQWQAPASWEEIAATLEEIGYPAQE